MLTGEGLVIAALPIGVLPAARNFGIADPFAGLDPDDADLTYLVSLSPFDPEAPQTLTGPPAPIGALLPIGVFSHSFRGAAPAVYLGDHHNYLSLPGDSPANTVFPGVLAPAYSLTARLGGAQNQLGGAAVDIGNIGIDNADGSQDGLLRRAFGDSPVIVHVGKAAWSFNVFRQALVGQVPAGGLRSSETRINLALTTILSRLDRNIARRYYAGSGGAEGGADLAGKPVTIVWGYCTSVPGRLLDGALQIWQFAASLSSMSNPRDRGVGGFTGGDDYPDHAALAAASLDPGDWATCIAEGLARFGSPVTLPTLDCEGPEAIGNLAGDIALAIVQGWLGAGRNLGAAQLDAGAFARLDAARPWETGFWLEGEASARSVLDQLMRDVGAALLATRDGLLSCVAHAVPGTGPSAITAADVDTDGITLDQRVVGVKRVTVLYAPRIRPLGAVEMPDTVPVADRLSLGAAALFATTTRSPMDPDARDVVIATNLRQAADAAALAAIAADLLSTFTHYYRIPLVARPFLHWLGDARRLTYDRFGAGDGLTGVVTEVVESSEGGGSLVLWGPRGGV
jgi:hypothetical protein